MRQAHFECAAGAIGNIVDGEGALELAHGANRRRQIHRRDRVAYAIGSQGLVDMHMGVDKAGPD